MVRLQEQILKTAEDYAHAYLMGRFYIGVSVCGGRSRTALAHNLLEFHALDETTWTYSDLILDKAAEGFIISLIDNPESASAAALANVTHCF